NYRESSYPVAVYRWHAENPTDKPVTVSVLLSWTNMLGCFRDFGPNMKGSLDHGNFNRFASEAGGGEGRVKGIVFDRTRPHNSVRDEFDGQWAIASVESPGVEISYQTTFVPENAKDAWANADKWSDEIDAWQSPYVKDDSKPLWYRGQLFNELYILTDGGSFWGRRVGSSPKTPHTFSFMECFDYPFHSTLDVLFYGDMPLTKFWPDLDK